MTIALVERELTVRNLSPLILRADRSRVQHNPGLDYIPGSAIRGAFAALCLQNHGNDDVFRAIFTDGRVSFGDLLPSNSDQAGRLLPATARACKYRRLEHAASLTDSLLRLAAAEYLGDSALLDETWGRCPECDQKLDRVSGYVTPPKPDFDRIAVRKRVLAGTAIQRFTGTADTGLLYSQEALDEGQVFKGIVRFFGNEAEKLSADLTRVAPERERLTLGAGRSRGSGLIEVGWETSIPEPSIGDRLESFESARRSLVQTTDEMWFSLTATSHLLLRDVAGRPLTSLDTRSAPGALPHLVALLGVPDARLRWYVGVPAVARGWNALQGLPKEDEPAIGRGSVFLISIPQGDPDTLIGRLGEIEVEGLGRRCAEGFGRISVCDAFHVQPVQWELEERSA